MLAGTVTLHADDHAPTPLAAGDSYVLPGGSRHGLGASSDDFELLEVRARR